MSFEISQILEIKTDRILARVNHGNRALTVIIPGQTEESLLVGKSYTAEIGYDRILSCRIIENFDDSRSGIWQEPDGIHLLGRVHNILDYGDGKTIVDVYMQNGPEFFTVDSEAVADIPGANDGLEITVSNLYIYPNER